MPHHEDSDAGAKVQGKPGIVIGQRRACGTVWIAGVASRWEDSEMPTDPIRHVVVLMLENHSFDQMLGAFRSLFPDLEGVDPASRGSNGNKDGMTYYHAGRR